MPTATTEWVRALELLARYPNGCSEALMLAHGFTVVFLAALVRGRLAMAGLTATHVVWIQITDLGREALARLTEVGHAGGGQARKELGAAL